jgi:hypothetical protein
MRPFIRPVFLVTFAGLVAAPGVSQTVALNPSVMVGWTGGAAVHRANQERSAAMAPGGYGSLGPHAVAVRTPPPAAAIASLRYRPDPVVRRHNLARFVANVRSQDPQSGAIMEHALAQNDIMAAGQQWLGRYGMSVTNVADATAAYLTAAWLATRGSDGDPSRAQITGVRNQLAAAMLSNPQFRSASDATKQEVAEANIVQAVMVAQFATAGKKDPGLAPKVRAAVAQGARTTYGFDLLSLDMTDRGFVPR